MNLLMVLMMSSWEMSSSRAAGRYFSTHGKFRGVLDDDVDSVATGIVVEEEDIKEDTDLGLGAGVF